MLNWFINYWMKEEDKIVFNKKIAYNMIQYVKVVS